MGVNPFLSASKDLALRAVSTRFRAYQLGEAGASYSYSYGDHLTLVEARRTEAMSHKSLLDEFGALNRNNIDCLHITSWDYDHCKPADLKWIIDNLHPKVIEYPGYAPHTESAKEALAIIKNYKKLKDAAPAGGRPVKIVPVDPPYIASLQKGENLGYKDLLYHPKKIYEGNSNNNSTVKLFRGGAFNVASLGDIEDEKIGALLKSCKIFCREVDVLILPHHGAPSKVATKNFFEAVRPSVAICTSNFDNQYDHPCQEIRDILWELRIPLFTTKTGDVLIESIGSHTTKYRLTNLMSDSSKVSSVKEFESKKGRLLSQNADTVRNLYSRHNRGPR
jgi:competence protein ComEC